MTYATKDDSFDADMFHLSSKTKSAHYPPNGDLLSSGEKKSKLFWKRHEQEREELQRALRFQESKMLKQERRFDQELKKERQRAERLKEELDEQIATEERQKQEDEENRRFQIEMEKQRERELELKRMGTSPTALLHLRELVRSRYELDMEIWRMRDTRRANRKVLEEKMHRADVLLREIQATVSSWKMDREVWEEDELDMAKEIQSRLMEDGKRNWALNPPWKT
ncbi:uncharacterized protein PV09_00959 [Verruconis gallopava]|uniref:Uncharacterized protein n=1 Tax=Verruconis gallopava TaxID=253628 RepID=A0A0D2AMU8_9PEZI|nr:uncharacterized protein PV09_00959 [Verruconis gallopava]KIW08013.1 hypothetical protein PV09_00959 [Verruconis gallopava]